MIRDHRLRSAEQQIEAGVLGVVAVRPLARHLHLETWPALAHQRLQNAPCHEGALLRMHTDHASQDCDGQHELFYRITPLDWTGGQPRQSAGLSKRPAGATAKNDDDVRYS